jgi:Putative transposase/Transposase zinc-binding domain
VSATVQDILDASLDGYLKRHRVPAWIERAVWALRWCRTARMGSHARVCPEGHVKEVHYNSCAHRACPQCSWGRIEQWLKAKCRQLLGCDHYHVVVTLPDVFRPLWEANRRRMTSLLFRTALEVVQELMQQRYGVRPGVLAALHTWTRALLLHVHLHLLVTGGGLTVDGQWKGVRRRYLLPGAQLRARLRRRFCDRVEDLLRQGRLELPWGLTAEQALKRVQRTRRKRWVVHIEPPYRHGRGVATYLARYARGGPLKNHQILAFDGRTVTFRYKQQRRGDRPRGWLVMTVRVDEFLRRLLLHIPPPRLHVVRGYGLYAPNQREALETARAQTGSLPETEVEQADEDELDDEAALPGDAIRSRHLRCPVCGRRLIVTMLEPRSEPPHPRSGIPPPALRKAA